MRGERVTTLLFDLGNVVLDWEPLKLYKARFDDPREAELFVSTICTMDWHLHHDLGVSFAENRTALIEAYPHYEDHIVAWDTEWLDMFHGYVEGMTDMLDTLQNRNVPLYALSNIPAEVWERTSNAFPHLNLFRDVVISGEEKIAKPDPEIYQIALNRMNTPPASVLFIDDRQNNVDAAEAMGLHGHVFDGADGLKKRLTALGLLD